MRSSSTLLFCLVAALLVAGCGVETSKAPTDVLGTPQGKAPGAPTINYEAGAQSFGSLLIADSQSVLHSADCRVDRFDAAGLLVESYREELISDGQSKFSLKVLETLIGMPMDWDSRKRIREGFAFRYGTFEVRDLSLAAQNFVIYATGSTRIIAGRLSDHFSISALVGVGSRYEIWVDPISGLVLRSERHDASDVLRFTREYEALNLAPDLSTAVWFQGVHNEIQLDMTQPLGDQVGLPVLTPSLLPAGYSLLNAFQLTDQGQTWIKLVYSNGIEPLFMLQRPVIANTGGGGKYSGKLGSIPDKDASDVDERLYVLDLDGVTGVHTDQPEATLEAVGTVDEQELVDLIISALPAG